MNFKISIKDKMNVTIEHEIENEYGNDITLHVK